MEYPINISVPFSTNIQDYPKEIQLLADSILIQIKPAKNLNGEVLPNSSAIYCETKYRQYVLSKINPPHGYEKHKINGQEKP